MKFGTDTAQVDHRHNDQKLWTTLSKVRTIWPNKTRAGLIAVLLITFEYLIPFLNNYCTTLHLNIRQRYDSVLKCLKTTWPLLSLVWHYPNVSMSKPRESLNFVQGNGAFHLVASRYHFWKEATFFNCTYGSFVFNSPKQWDYFTVH